jgi:ABC-type branched-subunit amino acid transport system permease subunit
MFIASFCSHVRTRVRRTYAVLAMMACGLAATVAMISLEGPAALAAPQHNVVPPGGSGEAPIVVPTIVHVTSGFATWQVAWIAAGAAILAAVCAVRLDRSRAGRLATSL